MTRPSNADATRLPGVHAPYRGGLAIIVVCLGSAWLGTVIAIALSPALPFIAATMGKGHDGAMVAQLLQTLPAITMLVGAGLAGYFSERWGRRLVIVAALAIYALSGATGLLTETLYPLVASRLILGFAGGVILTTSYAMMGEYFEGPRRERMLGFGSMMGSISAIVNLLAAGPMVDHLGWRAPFALYLPALILIPFALVGMHKDRTRAAHSRLSWKPVLALWPYLILLTAYTIGMYMSVIQTPFLVSSRGYGNATLIGFLVATTSAVAAVCAGLYGVLRPRFGFAGMFVFISAGLGFGMLTCFAADGLPAFVLGCALLGLGAGLIEPTIASAALERAPEELHDRAMGAVIVALFLGQFLNPLVLQPLRQIGGVDLAFLVVGGAYATAGVLFGLAALHRRRLSARKNA